MGPAAINGPTASAPHFNPPIPCGMGQIYLQYQFRYSQFQSTHPVWDGTLASDCSLFDTEISIHPSRVGWDELLSLLTQAESRISIHPSRVGWDTVAKFRLTAPWAFQSTHPVWDGTPIRCSHRQMDVDFNPPIPCGMGRVGDVFHQGFCVISIHPSRVGWDQRGRFRRAERRNFNPPIPCGMGHSRQVSIDRPMGISIHPSRVGWDIVEQFNGYIEEAFQSTHPVWDGTQQYLGDGSRWKISIHPSRVGWDDRNELFITLTYAISIHPSRVGWDHGYG